MCGGHYYMERIGPALYTNLQNGHNELTSSPGFRDDDSIT